MTVLLFFAAALFMAFTAVLFFQLSKSRVLAADVLQKNDMLEQQNTGLAENARMAEAYIASLVCVISAYLLKMEKIKRSVERKVMVKKYNEIGLSFNDINIRKERETFFSKFDAAFLKIFPTFLSEFNAMLHPEDQIWPKENQPLPTDLRIFALVRLGIADCETIAGILEYSERTIYVYKMRIKAKSKVPANQFDHNILAINTACFERPVYSRSA
ncbi:DUF6377 domain-containing protein [Mucilaginibacter gotjawali]|uniref:DUF6377 domain-containing protein n=1 Tax=Mucilaginibacter gotjawali TaxID=1550579 RepID=A0A839SII2_9SPHI|nr:DUF6377 domain-containing protein [Mucilaginibacter gotjawali]MBB3056690.1 hypothetical protein [Mucilaginibacter gotjawali]